MVKYCPVHKIGFNDELDPSCPQCGLRGMEPPEPVDEDPRVTAARKSAAKRPER